MRPERANLLDCSSRLYHQNLALDSEYLTKLETGRRGDPPIDPPTLDSYVTTHCIDPTSLRTNDFETFMRDREKRLLALIAKTTGHKVEIDVPADEDDVPDDIARDSGVMAIAASQTQDPLTF